MCDDGLAVADRLAIVLDIGKLRARRGRGIEDMFMPERHAGDLEEGEHLQAVGIVVGDAEQGGVGIEGEHCRAVRSGKNNLADIIAMPGILSEAANK